MSDPQIMVPDICQKHQWLLVKQARYSEADPWRALIVVANIALFQAATCDDSVHKRICGDITRIGEIGCLACCKPDAFGEIVEAAKSRCNQSTRREMGRSIEGSGMTDRPLKPGDRVEWRSGTRTVCGTVERVGTGKAEGLAMVLRDTAAKSELRQVKHLSRSTKTRTAWPARGDGAA